MQEAISIEPGMGVENAQWSPAVTGQPGTSPRGPLQGSKVVYRHLGVQLTVDLYTKVVGAARAEGSSTSAFVRRLVADRLGEVATHDRLDGIRVPPAELAGLSVALGHTTQLVLASRHLTDGQAAGAVMALERAHERLLKIIERMEH